MSFWGRWSPVERLLSHTPKKSYFFYLKEGKHWLYVLQNLTQSKSLVRAGLNAHCNQCNVRVWRFSTALVPKILKIRDSKKSCFWWQAMFGETLYGTCEKFESSFLGECISGAKFYIRGEVPSYVSLIICTAIYLDQWTSKLDVIIVNFTSFFNGQRKSPESAVFSARFAQLAEWDFEQLAFLMQSGTPKDTLFSITNKKSRARTYWLLKIHYIRPAYTK